MRLFAVCMAPGGERVYYSAEWSNRKLYGRTGAASLLAGDDYGAGSFLALL